MAVFTDQTIAGNFDPGAPPALPTTITVVTMEINDADDDGFIRPNSGDQINGSNVNSVWDGDTVTIDGVTITGVTFYTDDGARYFTPSDGSVLPDGGTATATTFVTQNTQFPVGSFGPPCFVAGSRIAVPGGFVPVEALRIGDLVETRITGRNRSAGSGSARFRVVVPLPRSVSRPARLGITESFWSRRNTASCSKTGAQRFTLARTRCFARRICWSMATPSTGRPVRR